MSVGLYQLVKERSDNQLMLVNVATAQPCAVRYTL